MFLSTVLGPVGNGLGGKGGVSLRDKSSPIQFEAWHTRTPIHAHARARPLTHPSVPNSVEGTKADDRGWDGGGGEEGGGGDWHESSRDPSFSPPPLSLP